MPISFNSVFSKATSYQTFMTHTAVQRTSQSIDQVLLDFNRYVYDTFQYELFAIFDCNDMPIIMTFDDKQKQSNYPRGLRALCYDLYVRRATQYAIFNKLANEESA